MDRRAELENQIKTQWLWNTSVNREYNQLTWVNTAAWDFYNSLNTNSLTKPLHEMSGKTTTVTPTTNAPLHEMSGRVPQTTSPAPNEINTKQVVTQTTPTPTTTQPVEKIESIEQFKQAWGTAFELERLIENRYGNAKTEWWKVTAEVNGEKFEWTIDSAWNPIKKSLWPVKQSSQDIFAQLSQGIQIPDNLKNTAEYKEAKQRFSKLNTFKWLTSSQYWVLLKKGILLPNTQLYNDLMLDSATAQALNQAKTSNTVNTSIKPDEQVKETETNQSEDILNSNLTVKSALADNELTAAEFKALTTTPEITAKQTEMEWLRDKYIELKNEWDNIEDDIRKQFEWRWLTSWYLAAKVARARKDMFKDLSLAQARYEAVMWDLSSMKQEATALLNTNLWLYKEAQAQERQLAAEQRQRAFQLEDRAYNEELQTRQLEQKYAYQFGDLNSDNPTLQNIAIERAVWSMYQNYPIPGMESQAVKVQKVKDLMAQGMSGTQAIAQVESEIRNSQRYKDYLASERAKITWSWSFGFQNVWGWTIAVTDPSTGQVRFESIQNVWEWITREKAVSTYWSTPAVRNFNPWNIMDTWFGGKRVEWERFTRFETPQEWFSALVAKIQNIQNWNSKVYSPNMSILEYISKYAPASDNNNPTAYANAIAKDLWVSINSKIGELDPVKLASSHAKHEDRNSYKMLQDLWIINTDWTLWQPSSQAETYNPDFTRYYQQVNTWWKLNTTETKMLAEAFWGIWEFNRQAKIYWQEIAVTRALPQLNDLESDLKYLKDNYSVANMASLAAWVGSYYSVWNNVRNKQAFQELVRLKENGATFWALSEKEFENIKFSTEVWKLNVTAWKEAWDTALNRMIRDVDYLRGEIIKDNPFTWQTQTWNTETNTYNNKKVYTDIKEIKKDFLNY
jgi:uncharacterized protein YoaH (UPF0181 family)